MKDYLIASFHLVPDTESVSLLKAYLSLISFISQFPVQCPFRGHHNVLPDFLEGHNKNDYLKVIFASSIFHNLKN